MAKQALGWETARYNQYSFKPLVGGSTPSALTSPHFGGFFVVKTASISHFCLIFGRFLGKISHFGGKWGFCSIY